MYIARTTLTRGRSPSDHSIAPLIDKLRASFRTAGVRLEHLTVVADADHITVTLYVQAASQTDADTIARLAGARLATDLPGWTCEGQDGGHPVPGRP
jgi:hypothetical protein